jgi:hypothetical protein
LKSLLFFLRRTGHFQVAKVGSIQHANQHLGGACRSVDACLITVHFQF